MRVAAVREGMGLVGGLLLLAASALPTRAGAQVEQPSCSPDFDAFATGDDAFGVVGSVYTVHVGLGANTISGVGDQFLVINRLRFELDCVDAGSGGAVGCPDEGAIMGFNGNIQSNANCLPDPAGPNAGVPVTWSTSTHTPPGDTSPNTVLLVPSAPVFIPEGADASGGNACRLEFDVIVNQSPGTDGDPLNVDQGTGYNQFNQDAVCTNALAAGAQASLGINLCRAGTPSTNNPGACSLVNTDCQTFACNTDTGACDPTNVNENLACDEVTDTNDCKDPACVAGVCTPAVRNVNENVACNDVVDTLDCADPACVAGTCTPGRIPVNETQACNDVTDTNDCKDPACVAGSCTPAVRNVNENVACNDVADTLDCADPACVAGTCTPGRITANDGQSCDDTADDGNPCSVAGCEAGLCNQKHACEPDGKPDCEITVGNLIFSDGNGNGLQDPDPGIGNVNVSLVECIGAGVTLDEVDTNGSGLYEFTVPAVDADCEPVDRTLKISVVPPGGFTPSPANVGADDEVDSDCDEITHMTACELFPAGSTDLSVDCGFIPPPAGCRVTGGGNAPNKEFTHGGQVGSPCGCIGCFPDLDSVQGQWEHNRKTNDGRFHASEFSSLVCDLDGGEGPLPRPAPSNKVCFAGKGLFAEGKGKRETPVAFRVEIEDRGEPGGGKNAGNQVDVYRMRMWRPPAGQTVEDLFDNICCRNPEPVGIDPPFIDDGGDIRQGNLQIHPSTPNTNRGICPPADEQLSCLQQALGD